jgi:3-keto-5-aminohexanoate cleavage enzyme
MDSGHHRKYILNLAPTGMIPTREMTPHVPLTPVEIVGDVLQAADLGITMVHLHARDPKTGKPSYKKDVYEEIIQGIREKNKDLILCVSTSGRLFNEFKNDQHALSLRES